MSSEPTPYLPKTEGSPVAASPPIKLALLHSPAANSTSLASTASPSSHESTNVDVPSSQASIEQKGIWLDLLLAQTKNQKFTLVESSGSQEDYIPSYSYDTLCPADPIKFVESHVQKGTEFGAIKLSVGSLHDKLTAPYRDLNPDTFTVTSKRVVYNPPQNELYDRLSFLKELLMLHKSSGVVPSVKQEPLVSPEPHSPEDKPTFMVLFNISKPGSPTKPNMTSNQPRVVLSRPATPPDSFPTPHLSMDLPAKFGTIPSIDNQPIDLYLLYKFVSSENGYLYVSSQNLWATIANKLGYEEGLETTSATLAETYAKVLYPLELKNNEKNAALSNVGALPEIGQTMIDPEAPSEPPRKIHKLGPDIPFLRGSAEEFPRSIRAKASKGILLNAPSQAAVKSTIFSHNELPHEKVLSQEIVLQINNYLQWIASNISRADTATTPWPIRLATSRTLSQIIKRDHLYHERILMSLKSKNGSLKPEAQTEPEILPIEVLEAEFMTTVQNSTVVNESGGLERFVDNSGSLSPTIMHPENNDPTHRIKQINGSAKSGTVTPLSCKILKINSDQFSTSVNPFNLQNLPFLPNSILAALNDADLDSKHLTSVSMNVGTTFSIENWKCEEHFTQKCDYLVAGAWKRWYFIPELDFGKYENLVEEIVATRESDRHGDKIEGILFSMTTNFPNGLPEDEIVVHSVANIPSDDILPRLPAKNAKLQQIIDKALKLTRRNLDYFITPAMLAERGIKYYTTIQKPGEMIYTYPKTYSCSISFGFNISEHVNFASKLWLEYGMEGERWLAKQSLLPNFLTFKLFVSLIHQLDTTAHSALHFESDVHDELLLVYSNVMEAELELRQFVRRLVKTKDILVEEKFMTETDMLSDVDFQPLYPTKVILQVGATQSLSMSLDNFKAYLVELEKDPRLPNLIKNSKVELHLFCPDEKLRSWRRLLQESSVDLDGWLEKYDDALSSEDILALRTYKLLLLEGQKIWAAISKLNANYLEYVENNSRALVESRKTVKIENFIRKLQSLRMFVEESNIIVEQCQTILSLKHQQRIRNGAEAPVQDHQDNEKHLLLLVDLCNKISKLSFYAPEFEQVSEFKNEIESFDRACRQLIDQNTVSSGDAADMISLGSSFGIKIPSLQFLIRLKDRVEWLKTYETIITGGDPFLGKKEIFQMPDLEKFRAVGAECLASADVQKLATIDRYLTVGHDHDHHVRNYIQQNQFLNGVNLAELENIMTDMEERVKLSGEKRLFVYLESYHKLLDLKAQESKIKFLQSYHKSQHALFDVQQMLHELKSVPYTSRVDNIEEAVARSKAWIYQVETYMETIKVRETAASVPKSHKQACSPRLMHKLSLILDNCKTAFTNLAIDSVEKSAPYAFYYGLEITEPAQTMRYCLCRDTEEGAMIECDRCHEWFHFNCVSHLSPIGEKEDDKYTCPACLVLERYKQDKVVGIFPEKLPEKKLEDLITYGSALRVQPTSELNLLKEIVEIASQFKSWAPMPCKTVSNDTDAVLVSELMCRKILGSPLAASSIIEPYLNRLVVASRPVPILPPQNDTTVSTVTENVPTTTESPGVSMKTENLNVPNTTEIQTTPIPTIPSVLIHTQPILPSSTEVPEVRGPVGISSVPIITATTSGTNHYVLPNAQVTSVNPLVSQPPNGITPVGSQALAMPQVQLKVDGTKDRVVDRFLQADTPNIQTSGVLPISTENPSAQFSNSPKEKVEHQEPQKIAQPPNSSFVNSALKEPPLVQVGEYPQTKEPQAPAASIQKDDSIVSGPTAGPINSAQPSEQIEADASFEIKPVAVPTLPSQTNAHPKEPIS